MTTSTFVSTDWSARRLDHGSIVVGTDGSPGAATALRWAAQEARTWTAALTIVHAWHVPAAVYTAGIGTEPAVFEDEGHAVLDRAVATVPELEADRALACVAVQADPGAALVKAAAHADLLVVGSRGHGGFLGLLLGSVSHWCANHAACPVAVVPASWDGDHAGRVVVGVDGSAPSYEALRWAVDEAARRGVELDVVHGYGYQQLVSPYGGVTEIEPAQARQGSLEMLEPMVAEALRQAQAEPPRVELEPVAASAATAVLEQSATADLLVLGSRGRGGFRRLLGSVSQECVHRATCPTVVVRPSPAAP